MEQILILTQNRTGVERLLTELHIEFGSASAVSSEKALMNAVRSGHCTVAIIESPEHAELERLVKACRAAGAGLPVLTLGGSADSLLQAGASAVLGADTTPAVVAEAVRTARACAGRQDGDSYFAHMIGSCSEMKQLFGEAFKVARADSTVHIRGESGTGKELIAKAIHDLSGRASMPFIAVNCAAIPDELLESELFGHKKGAFTGAIADKLGKFQQADGGTLFLDEIGDMKPHLQVKLLRVLQSREISPVGSTRATKIDVRIISATHQELERMVEKKEFRQDLYYRLAVFPLYLPALRDRSAADISELLDHFRLHFNSTKKMEVEGFDQEVIDILCQYPWPGNVRELENFVERMVVSTERGVITIDDLPDRYCPGALAANPVTELGRRGTCLNSAIDALETKLIREALVRTQGNRKEAASLLNVKRTTLVEKIRKFGLEQCHL